jgi:regulator of nucleoside diphosphate kinase
MKMSELIISRQDFGRLDVLLGGTARGQIEKVREFLLDELARARVVDESKVPASVVAMYSTVEFRDEDSGHRMVATLVYPHETDAAGQAVSVLTPVGAALIGLSEGQSIAYETPDRRLKTLTVLRVIGRGSSASPAPGNVSGDTRSRASATQH